MCKICEYCHKEYEVAEAESYFEAETNGLVYQNLTKDLCGNCAVEAVLTDKVDELYYEICQKCGKRFDLVVDEFEFECIVKGTDLVDQWNFSGQILCCDCALEDVEKM